MGEGCRNEINVVDGYNAVQGQNVNMPVKVVLSTAQLRGLTS